jgi:hypothetical protein
VARSPFPVAGNPTETSGCWFSDLRCTMKIGRPGPTRIAQRSLARAPSFFGADRRQNRCLPSSSRSDRGSSGLSKSRPASSSSRSVIRSKIRAAIASDSPASQRSNGPQCKLVPTYLRNYQLDGHRTDPEEPRSDRDLGASATVSVLAASPPAAQRREAVG